MEELLSSKNLLKGQAAVKRIIFHAMDGETVTVPIDNSNDNNFNFQDILVCYEMDGAPLTQGRGFPLRIIIPGRRVVKWACKIEVTQ